MAYDINNECAGMNFGEALAAGYKLGEVTAMRGYQSRTADENTFPVYIAGGSRRGELFVILPRYDTTIYCWRQYLVKEE